MQKFYELNEANLAAGNLNTQTAEDHIVVDRGEHVSPRFGVIKAPSIGDKVSMALNGDYYPVGEIVKITPKTMRVIMTSDGTRFYRQARNSSRWVANGCFALVRGHVEAQNPQF
jgi:hypothetical protein